MPISYENITDTLTNVGTTWSEMPSAPPSEAFTVSANELKRRRGIRIAFFGGLAVIFGLIIYFKTKNK